MKGRWTLKDIPGRGLPPLWAYAVVVGLTLLGILNLGFRTHAPASTFMLGVIISTWVGGTRAGLTAIGLAVLVLAYYFFPGTDSDSVVGELPRVGYFVVLSGFVVWLMGLERRTAQSLRRARDQMQTRNEELQKENDEGKALEGLLRRNEAALRLYVDSIPAMTWTVEPDGRVDFLSRRWLEYSGITLEEGLANPVHGMHPRDAPRAFALWQRCIETRQPFEAEIRLRRADGEYRWFLVRTTPLLDENGKVLKWFGTSTDIEDRKRAEERLQQLSRRLVELHEDESRDLSRELHDEFGQLLATTGLHLQTARTTSGPEAEASLDRALALLQRAGAQVRGMALELRPTFLESSGLESTLRWLATQHEQRAGLAVRVTGTLGDIPADIAIAGYRVVQQALTNVVQHAHARTVSIQLAQDPSSMHLVIEDDGVGFDVAKTLGDGSGHGQLGLLGMRERVQVFGGTLQIDSRPERGARIAVSIPMAADAVTAGGEESDEDARAAGR